MPEEHAPIFNANSAIIGVSSFIILGVLGWIGNKAAENATSTTRIEATLPYVSQSITDLKGQLSTMVTKAEFEARVAELKAADGVLDRRLGALESERRNHP